MKRTRGLFAFAVFMTLVATASAGDNAMFNYQGRVLVQGMPYTGAGRMKAAILATTGSATISLWSNDGSSVAGSQPAGSFAVDVSQGVFDAMIGDAALGMEALPAILFNRDDELKVRVWFNDGTHGFQQLSPDRRLTNPRRMGLARVTSPLWVYVNSTTGNDWDSGLTTDTAKRTVQAAIDMLPRSIRALTTIRLASGTYSGFTIAGFKDVMDELVIEGDTAHDPTLSQSLDVIVQGSGTTGILVQSSERVRLKGILTQNWYNGVNCKDSQVEIDKCQATGCYFMGFLAERSSMGLNNCLAYHNTQFGAGFVYATGCLRSSICDGNQNGLMVYHNSSVACIPATLRNNGTGLISRYLSSIVLGSINYSGNTLNTNVASGSGIY
ncbi:MAG: hypothetical protein ABFD69_13570 [Candidatus Sumerlaeia bacterium]